MKKLVLWIVMLAVLAIAGSAFTAEDENLYVGDNAKTCKMCHKDQVAAWSEWSKASSWDSLSEEEQKNDDCVKCHVTGYGEPGGFVSFEETPKLVGVQCEACHGPAGKHMKAPMTDKEAKKATIVMPDEDTCLVCHIEEGNPNYVEFKFEDANEAISDHFIPEEK